MLLRRAQDAHSRCDIRPRSGPNLMGHTLPFYMNFHIDSRSRGHFLSTLSADPSSRTDRFYALHATRFAMLSDRRVRYACVPRVRGIPEAPSLRCRLLARRAARRTLAREISA
jgi:hypothetical protein